MEENKTGGFLNTAMELSKDIDENKLGKMTITNEMIKSSFTITCSKWTNDFRDYIADINIEDEFKELQKILDGTL